MTARPRLRALAAAVAMLVVVIAGQGARGQQFGLRYHVTRHFELEAAGLKPTAEGLSVLPPDEDFVLTACLAPERNVLAAGGLRNVVDYASGTVRFEALDGSSWDEGSLDEQPTEVLLELPNRLALHASFQAAAVSEDEPGLLLSFEPFELFCLFGHELDLAGFGPDGLDPGPAPALEVHDGATRLVRAGEVVAQWTPSGTAVPEPLRAAWGRLVARQVRTHPLALERLAADGLPPARLDFRFRNGGVLARERWELVDAGDCVEAGEPLPEGAPRVRRVEEALASVLDRPLPPGAHDDLARARAFFADGKMLEGFLAAWRANVRDGEDMSPLLAEQGARLSTDPRLVKVFATLGAEDDKVAAGGLALIEEVEAQRPEGWEMLQVARADTLARLDRLAEAEALFLTVLAAQPDLGGAWKDLGDVYFRAYRPIEAWACWDRLREVAPRHPFLADVDGFQARLRADFPRMY